MSSLLLPSDAGWTEEKAFIAGLTSLIAQLTKYVMRYLDADAERVESISPEEE